MPAVSEMLVAIETPGGSALIWREVAFVCWQEPGVDTPHLSRYCYTFPTWCKFFWSLGVVRAGRKAWLG